MNKWVFIDIAKIMGYNVDSIVKVKNWRDEHATFIFALSIRNIGNI